MFAEKLNLLVSALIQTKGQVHFNKRYKLFGRFITQTLDEFFIRIHFFVEREVADGGSVRNGIRPRRTTEIRRNFSRNGHHSLTFISCFHDRFRRWHWAATVWISIGLRVRCCQTQRCQMEPQLYAEVHFKGKLGTLCHPNVLSDSVRQKNKSNFISVIKMQ